MATKKRPHVIDTKAGLLRVLSRGHGPTVDDVLSDPARYPNEHAKLQATARGIMDAIRAAVDDFHSAAAELVPDWNRRRPNWLLLQSEITKATGVQPNVWPIRALAPSDARDFIQTAAKMKTEERAFLLTSLRELTAQTQRAVEEVEQYVTLAKCASISGRKKRTLQADLNDGELPAPDVPGGGGRTSQWLWANIRPHLERLSRRKFPTRYPDAL